MQGNFHTTEQIDFRTVILFSDVESFGSSYCNFSALNVFFFFFCASLFLVLASTSCGSFGFVFLFG